LSSSGTEAPAAAADAAAIGDLHTIPIALPLRRDWRWRGLGQELGHWVLVRLETEDGAVGWGEATPLSDWGGDFGHRYGETPQTVCHVLDDLLAPALRGIDVWDSATLTRRADEAVRGHPYARAALDIAVWDVRGRLAGQPIHRLLGGTARTLVPVAHMLGLMSAADAVEEARAAWADGVKAFQIKVTGELGNDLEVLASVRDGVGPDAFLRVDVNQGYAHLPIKQAIDSVRQLAGAGADVVEQPVEGLRALAAVRAAVDTSIMADESCWNAADAAELARLDAADAISVYVAKAGGLREARRVAEIAEVHGLACDVNGSLESGIGTAASVHLAAACPSISLPAVIPCPAPAGTATPKAAGRYYEDDVFTEPMEYRDGGLVPPQGPGLGLTVDEDKVRELSVEGSA
jgi:L-alanine-DL-glutamate epimerase-like enolase superfamily enzyme